MNHIKTVKRFVAGSIKFFDIYECTVDEVDTYTSSTGKSMVKVSIEGKEYNGLHNKWVAWIKRLNAFKKRAIWTLNSTGLGMGWVWC